MNDPIFESLLPDSLHQIAVYTGFDPVVGTNLFSALSVLEQTDWLDNHRQELQDHISWVGTSLLSYALGNRKTYAEIVCDVAKKIKADCLLSASTEEMERGIIFKLWNDALTKMTAQEQERLRFEIEALSTKLGKNFRTELSGVAALTAAQLSGFGVYLLGSTVLGFINSALGLGLGFGAFAGLSSLISTIIGPIGWASLGLFAIVKLGAPNYKKLLPVVVLVATQRGRAETPQVAENAHTVITEIRTARMSQFTAPTRIVPHSAASAGVSSKREKTSFNLKHPDLSNIALELTGLHFLDLPTSEQEIIMQLAQEREEFRIKVAQEEKKQARKSRKEEERQFRADRRLARKNGNDPAKKRKEFRHLLPSLEFTDESLIRFCALEHSRQISFLTQFKQLNDGEIASKHHVPGSSPKLFQRDAGAIGKVYYRRSEDGARIVVHLIGTKNDQDVDYALMRKQ